MRGKTLLICENHASCREMLREQRNANTHHCVTTGPPWAKIPRPAGALEGGRGLLPLRLPKNAQTQEPAKRAKAIPFRNRGGRRLSESELNGNLHSWFQYRGFQNTVSNETPQATAPEAVKQFNGRDALLRVRDGKPKTDAEHRVPTPADLQAKTDFFTAPLPLAERFRMRGEGQPRSKKEFANIPSFLFPKTSTGAQRAISHTQPRREW